jgi:hypothetical protein
MLGRLDDRVWIVTGFNVFGSALHILQYAYTLYTPATVPAGCMCSHSMDG